jgi:hypothetical protein
VRVLASVVCLATAAAGAPAREQAPASSRPGARVALDAHNAYPYNGRFADRIGRALATGLPVAIEQDLVWRPAANGRGAHSIVSHGEPYDGSEPSLREHFFERIRPIVEQALKTGDPSAWPLITLNLDLKSNEPEHHRALWDLLGAYESWLTTAERVKDGSRPAPLDVKPVLVLTGESDAQEQAFHRAVPAGARLRLFGAIALRPPAVEGMSREAALARFREMLTEHPLPRASNYRRWWNAPWAVVEAGGQREAASWTPHEDARLRTLVRHAHEAGLWIRVWTLNGHPIGDEKASGWSTGYNVGSRDAVERRWRAAIAAGVDYVATDQYEAFAAVLRDEGRHAPVPREVVLEGTISPADRLTWIERPFAVPPGTARIDVVTSYTDRDRGTAIEFGLYDPVRFRGASRTSKTRFFVSRTAATPSYHPGELTPGTWRLLMGIPSIRDGAVSTYRAIVRLTPEGPSQPAPLHVPDPVALGPGPRWFHGDLHAHTMHSDGFGCGKVRGERGPCATHLIADEATRRGLDFVAITDHNTTSHHAGMVDVQARHERLLLLRGQEVTTFYGHANVFGTSEPLDFRVGSGGRTAHDLFVSARRLGALVSINHPGRETGERCTGCGWNAPGTDYSLLDAIEVVNGRVVSGPTAGEPVWHARLNEGYRITGIGGGDDHAAGTRQGSGVGTPTTVVYAESLTESALLAGIRAGRAYIKVRGPEGPDLRFRAVEPAAGMGDVVATATPRRAAFRLTITRGTGQRVDVIRNGVVLPDVIPVPIGTEDATLDFALDIVPGDWVRVNLRDETGVTVMANPIYFR